MLRTLAWKELAQTTDLLQSKLLRHGDEEVRGFEIAVELRDLVLENEVVSPRVPRQLAEQAMGLVEVLARVGQDDVRLDSSLQVFKDVLHLASEVREVPVPKLVDLDARLGNRRENRIGARSCLLPALAGSAEHDPG